MLRSVAYIAVSLWLVSCGGNRGNSGGEAADSSESVTAVSENSAIPGAFDADSAYMYVSRQVDFGPRVPNSEAHHRAADWLAAELRRHGAEVTEQRADLKAFDGTILHARNIFGRYNPEQTDRTLLLAHYDCRPWADQDSDSANHKLPVDGANDGASGVGVLLEMARQMNSVNPGKGIDILFVDAEDWGAENDDDSWALGARYFVENPIVDGYRPDRVVVLDMVGGKGAQFPVEYFSQQSAPALVAKLWGVAAELGYGQMFPKRIGSAVTDDHQEFIKQGIPAVDIIDYRPGEGFNPTWHTSEDTMENIDRSTLKAVGDILMKWIYE